MTEENKKADQLARDEASLSAPPCSRDLVSVSVTLPAEVITKGWLSGKDPTWRKTVISYIQAEGEKKISENVERR